MTDDEAIIVMVDSNLQREQILPSEKAFAYKMKLETMKRQGKRTDLTCASLAHKLAGKKAWDVLAEQVGESKDQVRRYIRLTHLIPEILDLADNAVLKEKNILRIALRPAVELFYLTEKEQQDLQELMEIEDYTPSHAQAIRMPKTYIFEFFAPGTSVKTMEDTIVKVLELYCKNNRIWNNSGRDSFHTGW